MADTFRDPHEPPLSEAIARVLWAQNPLDDHVAANAILAMPELQAIKAQLRYMARELATGCNDDVNHGKHHAADDEAAERYWLGDRLSPGVVEWVMTP